MSVSWLTPAAWWGLASLAVPILIHLLARERNRRMWFPSLRFLRATRVSALKRRRISDWLLFVVRSLILAFAVAALAAPVFVSDARWRSWNARITRAVVIAPVPPGASTIVPQAAALAAEARRGSFASEIFDPTETIADGLRDAAEWLGRQPPSLREVVVIGDFRVGALTAQHFAPLTPATGIRLLPVADPAPLRNVRLRATADDGTGVVVAQTLDLALTDQTTTVERRTDGTPAPAIRVIAALQDQRRADAALRAVLAEGIVLPRGNTRRIVVEFAGSSETQPLEQPARELWMRRALEQLPGMDGGARDGQLVVRTGSSAADPDVASTLARVIAVALADDLGELEPNRLPAGLLAQWSRPAGEVPRDAVPGDEGDRRYFWAAALVLLLLEQWIRRSRRSAPDELTSADRQEERVA
jgi:hypothetical protein